MPKSKTVLFKKFKVIQNIDDETKDLIVTRRQARDSGDYDSSDKLRDRLLKKGYRINDSDTDAIWSRV